jgi:isoleucyl-tRNA synthetase
MLPVFPTPFATASCSASSYIFDKEGADAMRWYFFSAQAPWTSTRFQERAIAESQRDFLIRLYNVYSFFVIYANIDQWSPPAGWHGQAQLARVALTELDRWILAELHRTAREVRRHMDAYDNFAAARELIAFVDVLSNWYVRRSRDRFWAAGMSPDKQAAYATLYECLVTTAKLIAPFVPYFAESIYQNLVRTADAAAPASVHLCDYPVADEAMIDETLIREAATVREIVSLGRAARAEEKLRVRQPLRQVEIVVADRSLLEWLEAHKGQIADELNVKTVAFISEADQYVEYRIAPNFKAIGPKFGPLAPKIKEFLAKVADPAALRRELDASGRIAITIDGRPIELTSEDVQIGLVARPGWAAAQGRNAVVVLSTEIDDALRSEGLAREIVHHVQQLRKKMQLRYEQRIELGVAGDETVTAVVGTFGDYIAGETLATKLTPAIPPGATSESADIEGHATTIAIRAI